jgi:hypothetical protein
MARLTFDQLYRMSEAKRITRSSDVSGPPLDIDSYRDAVYYCFNFKSRLTNTTGLRHRGYVKFFRPRNRKAVPLQHLECLVDCECPDFRYRWAWANKQRQSSMVGPQSLNQAWNRAPRKTNPKNIPGLCKHILAVSEYIFGLVSSFPSSRPDTSEKFDKLLRHATKRWDDFEGEMARAREKQGLFRKRMRVRNIEGPLGPEEPGVEEPPVEQPGGPQEPQAILPPELPVEYELPAPGEEGDEDTQETPGVATMPTTPAAGMTKTKGRVEPGGFPTVAQRRAARYGENVSVGISNSGRKMKELLESMKLVEEIQDEMTDLGAPPDGSGSTDAMSNAEFAPDLPPSEPPISDSAIGADTEGETALDLLRQIRFLLNGIITIHYQKVIDFFKEGRDNSIPIVFGKGLPIQLQLMFQE